MGFLSIKFRQNYHLQSYYKGRIKMSNFFKISIAVIIVIISLMIPLLIWNILIYYDQFIFSDPTPTEAAESRAKEQNAQDLLTLILNQFFSLIFITFIVIMSILILIIAVSQYRKQMELQTGLK